MNVGDYVMGIDRSYKRSVYRVHKIINTELFDLEFICLGGRMGGGLSPELSPNRAIKDFGILTPKEVHKELGYTHFENLVWLLCRTGVTKSYPEPL